MSASRGVPVIIAQRHGTGPAIRLATGVAPPTHTALPHALAEARERVIEAARRWSVATATMEPTCASILRGAIREHDALEAPDTEGGS